MHAGPHPVATQSDAKAHAKGPQWGRSVRLKRFNEEVLFADERIVKLGRQELDLLIQGAKANQRKRMRICAHPDAEDRLHEMFIVIQQGSYIRPHKHLNKSESFHVIEGSVDIVLFDDYGNITGVNRVADHASGEAFYHRISDPCFHTLLIRSDFLVFHEITNGPFRPDQTEYAPWSPEETNYAAVQEYMDWLARTV